MAKETKVPCISIEVVRGEDGTVDVEATLRNAEKVTREYASTDKVATSAVIAATEAIFSNEKYAKEQRFSASTIAKMALIALDQMPTDKACKEAEERVSAFFSAQEDKFLKIDSGRNAGFWVRDRLSADDLARLTKTKAV